MLKHSNYHYSGTQQCGNYIFPSSFQEKQNKVLFLVTNSILTVDFLVSGRVVSTPIIVCDFEAIARVRTKQAKRMGRKWTPNTFSYDSISFPLQMTLSHLSTTSLFSIIMLWLSSQWAQSTRVAKRTKAVKVLSFLYLCNDNRRRKRQKIAHIVFKIAIFLVVCRRLYCRSLTPRRPPVLTLT